jgi:hypothetical protein
LITFFTIPKPFEGHIGVIQRNALASWKHVHRDAEVLLLGDEPGAEDAARELELRHLPELARNEYGTPLLDDAFRIAEQHAGTPLLAYVNSDILMPPTVADAATAVQDRSKEFLLIGECWNARVEDTIDSDAIDWRALHAGAQKRGADAIDYFVFTRGLYASIPPVAVGRMVFDNWLVWHARSVGARLVDATSVVRPIHQDHSYAHVGSLPEVRVSAEARQNRELAGGGRSRLYSRFDATHRLTRIGLIPNPLGWAHAGETVRRAWAKLGYMTGLRRL